MQPLQELLSTKTQWVWGEAQDRAFASLKDAITSSEVLAMYDPTLETIVSADVSAYGLRAVLRQKQQDCNLRPVAYIS